MRASFWVSLLLLIAPPASAQVDLGARITPSGLNTLTSVALDRVPPVFAIDRLDPVLFDCPGDDVVAHVPPTDVSLRFRELDIRTDDGRIILSTTLDIDAAATVQIDNANACLGTALCDVSVNLDRLGIVVELAAGTGADGRVEFHGARVDLALTSEDLALDSVGCAVGDVATWLFDAIEAWALDLLTPRLEMAIGDRLGAALTDLFAETVGITIEREGFSVAAHLDTIDLTRLEGVTVGGGVDVRWTGTDIYSEPPPDIADPEGPPLPSDVQGDFQFAVSDRLVNQALYEAWRGGFLRRLLADQSQSVSLGGAGVAQLIGLQRATDLDIRFDIERPLSVSFGRVAPDTAEMTMRDLHVTVVSSSAAGDGTIELYASASGQVALTMSSALGGMVMDVREMEVTSVRVETSNEDLELSGARLARFVSGTVVPMLGERLTGLPVAPGLHPIAGTFIHVREVSSAGGWQRVGADLITIDLDDVVPPETSIESPAELLAAGTAAFEATGVDASTPTELLRYVAWVDGAILNEGTPSSVRTIRFDVTGGEHTLEVAAVDLNDNQDMTPAVHVFQVDGTPPQLTVTQSPLAIVTEPSVILAWTASDAEGAVTTRWVLREIGDDGEATVVQEAPFGDRTALELAASSLDQNTLYEIEIIARDQAGNLASQAFGFALQGGGLGCAAAPGGGPRTPLLMLALGLVALTLRRRR